VTDGLRKDLDAASRALESINYQYLMLCGACEHGADCRHLAYTRAATLELAGALGRLRTRLGWDYDTGQWATNREE
jgi:hypothetical protein